MSLVYVLEEFNEVDLMVCGKYINAKLKKEDWLLVLNVLPAMGPGTSPWTSQISDLCGAEGLEKDLQFSLN